MYRKIRIAALAALIWIPGATMAGEKPFDSFAPKNIFANNPIFDAKPQASMVLAQSDKSTPEDSEKAESESATRESEAVEAENKKLSEDESKPLKPFVPSEQIAGDQAVDFPADI